MIWAQLQPPRFQKSSTLAPGMRPREERSAERGVSRKMSELGMFFFPWPIGADDPLLNQSLKIAMDYLQLTGQAEDYPTVQQRAAFAILASYRQGARHPIRLGNCGVRAVENAKVEEDLQSFYPRVS